MLAYVEFSGPLPGMSGLTRSAKVAPELRSYAEPNTGHKRANQADRTDRTGKTDNRDKTFPKLGVFVLYVHRHNPNVRYVRYARYKPGHKDGYKTDIDLARSHTAIAARNPYPATVP
jgi:hypothetical protein